MRARKGFVAFFLVTTIGACGGGGPGSKGPVVDASRVDCTNGTCAEIQFAADDGFGFANWGGEKYPNDSFGVNEMVALYGPEQVCEEFKDDYCVMNPGATQRMTELNAMLQSGRCEGMVVLAGRLKLGLNSIGDIRSNAPSVAELEPEDPYLLDLITYWWGTQFGENVIKQAASFRKLRPSELALELAAGIRAKAGYSLGLYSDGRGHAVLPVAVRKDAAGVYSIDVYDGNAVGEIRTLTIDSATETWKYKFAASNADVASSTWTGTTGTLDLTPMSSREDQALCETCSDATGAQRGAAPVRVSAIPKGSSTLSLRIQTDDGGKLEIGPNGTSTDIKGAIVQESRDGDSLGSTILLPAGTDGIRLSAATEGDATNGALITLARPGNSPIQVDLQPGGSAERTGDTVIEVDAATDGASISAGSGTTVNTSIATESQAVEVSVTENQQLEVVRTAGADATTQGLRVVVREGDQTVVARTIDATAIASSTSISTVGGTTEIRTGVIERAALSNASVLADIATKNASTRVDAPISRGASSTTTSTTTLVDQVKGGIDVATGLATFDAAVDSDVISLTWDALPQNYVSGIIIEVADAKGTYREVARRSSDKTSYKIAGLDQGEYRVRLRVETVGADVYSKAVTVTVAKTVDAVAVPGVVTADAKMTDTLKVSWSTTSTKGLVGFTVWGESAHGKVELYRAAIDERDYSRAAIPGLENVWVVARYSNGETSKSATIKVGDPLPKADTIDVVAGATLENGQVTVTWTTTSTISLTKWVVWVRDVDAAKATVVSTRPAADRSFEFPRPAGNLEVYVVGDFGSIGNIKSSIAKVPAGAAAPAASTSSTSTIPKTTTTAVPDPVLNLRASVDVDQSIALTWDDPGVAVTKWEILVDGKLIATVGGNVHSYTARTETGSRKIAVRGDIGGRFVTSNVVTVEVGNASSSTTTTTATSTTFPSTTSSTSPKPPDTSSPTTSTSTTTTVPSVITVNANATNEGGGKIKIAWTTTGGDPAKWLVEVDGIETVVSGSSRFTIRSTSSGSRVVKVTGDYGTSPAPSKTFTIVVP